MTYDLIMGRHIAILLILILSFSLLLPAEAFAGTSVSVGFYWTGGFVVGGVSIFWVFISGDTGRHRMAEKIRDDATPMENFVASLNKSNIYDYSAEPGMIKIFQW